MASSPTTTTNAMKTNCTMCTCSAFQQNIFDMKKCKDCFHLLVEHEHGANDNESDNKSNGDLLSVSVSDSIKVLEKRASTSNGKVPLPPSFSPRAPNGEKRTSNGKTTPSYPPPQIPLGKTNSFNNGLKEKKDGASPSPVPRPTVSLQNEDSTSNLNVNNLSVSNNNNNVRPIPNPPDFIHKPLPAIPQLSSTSRSTSFTTPTSPPNTYSPKAMPIRILNSSVSSPSLTTTHPLSPNYSTSPEVSVGLPISNSGSSLNLSKDTDDGLFSTHRDRVAREIVTSERTYIENLQLVVDYFVKPIRKEMTSPEPLLTMPQASMIFSNIEDIIPINRELLSGLEERLANWSSTQKLGDVFERLSPFLKMYTTYTAGYGPALQCLKEVEKLPNFAAFLQKCLEAPECKGLNLRSFLIQPVQRIPRYNMLLEDLIKHTEKTHLDYENLVKSLNQMKVVAADINESVRLNENRAKVMEIQSRLSTIQGVPRLIEPHRLFILEGSLTKICRKSRKRRLFFLFTDILIYGSTLPNNKYLFHRMIPLDTCRLEDIPDGDVLQFAFQISSAGKSFIVYADALDQKLQWLLHLTTQIDLMRKKRMTFRGGNAKIIATPSGNAKDADSTEEKSGTEMIVEAPVWVPDDIVTGCAVCKEEFTVLKRRHHCRACGEVVCASCSDKKWKISAIDKDKKVRVCNSCYDYFSLQASEYAAK